MRRTLILGLSALVLSAAGFTFFSRAQAPLAPEDSPFDTRSAKPGTPAASGAKKPSLAPEETPFDKSKPGPTKVATPAPVPKEKPSTPSTKPEQGASTGGQVPDNGLPPSSVPPSTKEPTYPAKPAATAPVFTTPTHEAMMEAMTGIGPHISVAAIHGGTHRPATNWIDQSRGQAMEKSEGCMECHTTTDATSMHKSPNVVLGCTDCHGGNARRGLTAEQAHVKPLNPKFWVTSANPIRATVLLNHESPEFIRFVNPGDLRVAAQSCGLCHGDIVRHVQNSMMNHGTMLWNAAAYNNGAINIKDAIVGQGYGADGVPLTLNGPFKPTAEETRVHGWIASLIPLPRFTRSMPGNVFRIFEKGGMEPLSIGLPNLEEPPGKPERRLSDRGLGTLNRTDPVILGAAKTRLHDPLLGFMGSNDRPGDYRTSGCSACHVVYANDRSPTNSGWWYKFGNQGLTFTKDPTIPKDERGHPVFHEFTRAVPSSQCMNCHMHQGNLFVNPFLGYTWWDQETDGELMYPKKQHDPDDNELVLANRENPEGAAARGLWGNRDFLEKVAELNPQMKHTQFADYHGHGWIFRAIFKHDREGNLLDLDDKKVPFGDFQHAVHLNDIHIQKGMQCVDCHFDTEVHGNGLLYGEPRNSTTIMCIDCHGTIEKRPTLVTSGAGGIWDGHSHKTDPVDLSNLITPWAKKPRFEWDGDKLYQNSTMTPGLRWEIPQTIDVINPASSHYNAKAAYAKTVQRDGVTWGGVPNSPGECKRNLAHANENFDCQICHTSWATSCFGCHLSMKANQRVPQNKYEGVTERNYTTYNPQVVRDDVFQLGVDGTVKQHRMAVLRSSSAVVVDSQNGNREWVYSQQQTVSAEGYSGQAYNPHFPHTTSGKGTTKNCTDCHLSKANDNNAWMGSLLGFGTGSVNFFGRYAWVGGEDGIHGVVWTEPTEPQAAIGSHLHEMAYPRNYEEHVNRGRILTEAYEHHAREVNDITLRGEYVYTANGPGGMEVFDVANIDQKGFSERIVSSPVSPLGQKTYVRTKFATAVAMPSTLAIDPKREHLPANEEQPIDPFYNYVYVTDREEGLVIVDVSCLFDGDPENNFLRRLQLHDDKGFSGDHYNPDGKLTGAAFGVCAGHRVFICTPTGFHVVDVSKPESPRLVGGIDDCFHNAHCVAIQFRYAFVTDDDGLKVIDISDPVRPRTLPRAFVPLRSAHKLYIARTYAYVADGQDGLAIIDVINPERPRLTEIFNADGALNDTQGVQIGSVNASMYALVADGHNGFRVLQMISPDTVPGAAGFSPKPAPRLIATFHTPHPALAVSRGLDRDRVVDETGGQTVVFGRRGSRPFHVDEMRQFLEHADGSENKVEDVSLHGGDLHTSSGKVLTPTEKYVPPPSRVPPPPPLPSVPPNDFPLPPTSVSEARLEPAAELPALR